MTRPAIVVVGPTGAGKSKLAISLARACRAEVLSADSQQVYRGMDIGTGKVTSEERGDVVHHLIDVTDPDDEMTVGRFLELADGVIADAERRGVPLVIAGGTMLYVRVLLRGIFDGPPADETVRAALEAEAAAAGGEVLWNRLAAIDPSSSERIDPADVRRVVRALEVHTLTGITMSEHQRRHDFRSVPLRFPAMLIGLAPEREKLYARINQRVEEMLTTGLVDEVRALRAAGYTAQLRSQQAIGYREVHSHFDGEWSLDDATRLIKRNSRRYARRQLSWYRRDTSISWHQDSHTVDLALAKRYLG